MKILFYISSLAAGGAERVVSTLANYWVLKGHDIVIVTVKGTDSDFYRLNGRVARLSLDSSGASGSRVTRMFSAWRRIVRLRAQLRRLRPNVAISLIDTANVSLALAGFGMRDTIQIGSERVYPPFANVPLHWRVLRRFTYGFLHGIVALTPENAEWLKSNTWARKAWIVPNPVSLPLDRVEPICVPATSGARPNRVLAVGRYARQKGFDLLIEAFGLVSSDLPDWELVIVGEGEDRAQLESKIHSLGLADRVTLAGKVGNLSDWYASADLFVLSSRFEGFPNALLEAMAHGLPVIACDCLTGPRSLIRHGENGLLVEPEDITALASAMTQVMSDDGLRATLAVAASRASQQFAVDKVARIWEGIFESESATADGPVRR